MSTRLIFGLLVLILGPVGLLHAQDAPHRVEGVVMEETANGKFLPLEFVNVRSLTDDVGTVTDSTGYFSLDLPPVDSGFHVDLIIVSYVGFVPDTINVSDQHYLSITLRDNTVLDEVEIVRRKATSEVSFLDPRLVENISQDELFKAACCNLSESFETNASVDVTFTDAVTGAKELQMLGLAGKYTLISREYLPGIRGLLVPYGLLFTPGAWVESMQVTKGAGTVVNGYESMAGQINVELKKPEGRERLHVNAFLNEMLRTELNFNTSIDVSPTLKTEILAHGHIMPREFDRNDDGFIDAPTGEMFVLANRWNYNNNKGLLGQVNATYTFDDQTGGQTNFVPEDPSRRYGVLRKTNQLEVSGKTGFVFPGKRYQSIGLQWSYTDFDQEMLFGLREYDSKWRSAYGNLIFQSLIGSTMHKYKVGLSILHDDVDEVLGAMRWDRNETAVGAFAEYTFTPVENFTAVAGFRVDRNNIHGMLYTPRLHLRYAPTQTTVVRGSVGRGYRSPNVISENLALLASSRQLFFEGDENGLPLGLRMESAWNFGVSVSQEFTLDFRIGRIGVEFFRTDFTDQVVVDLDQSPQEAHIYNLRGQSFSNNFQVDLSYEVLKRLDVKMAYRRSDVRTDYAEGLLERPLVPRDRGFINAGYRTRQGDKGYWMFDATVQVVGRQRLATTASNPEELRLDEYAPVFATVNTQITRSFTVGKTGTKTALDVYIGAENLLNYMQDNPILSADDPFGAFFDSGFVWGPIFGRNVYLGIRYTLDKRDKE